MKKIILSSFLGFVSAVAVAQGTVLFGNASSIVGWEIPRDRNVKFDPTAALYDPLLVAGANVSSNYDGVNLSGLRAALFFAPGTLPDANWRAVTNLAMATSGSTFATFKQSTSTTAGSWFGGSRTMQGVPASSAYASLMVVVWDTDLTMDPFAPAAASGLWGRSTVFQYMTAPSHGAPNPPGDFLMQNLESFNIGALFPPELIPEPAAPALVGLFAVVLLLFRRRGPRASRVS